MFKCSWRVRLIWRDFHQTTFVIKLSFLFIFTFSTTLTFAKTKSKYQNYPISFYLVIFHPLFNFWFQLKCYTIQPICSSLLISAYMWHPIQNWYFASMTTALSRKMHYWGTAGKNHDDTWGIPCQMSESGMKNKEALSMTTCHFINIKVQQKKSDTLLLQQLAYPLDLDSSNSHRYFQNYFISSHVSIFPASTSTQCWRKTADGAKTKSLLWTSAARTRRTGTAPRPLESSMFDSMALQLTYCLYLPQGVWPTCNRKYLPFQSLLALPFFLYTSKNITDSQIGLIKSHLCSPPVMSVLTSSPVSSEPSTSPLPGSSRSHSALDGAEGRTSHSAPERPPAPKLPSISSRSTSSPGLAATLPPPSSPALPPLQPPPAASCSPGSPTEEGGLPKRITLPPISENTRQSLANGTAGVGPPAGGATSGGGPPAPAAAPAPAEEPLPPGWEMRYDQYGRRYYVDHNTRSTTWERPQPLPTGWEMRRDPRGRVYYVDHNTRQTTWQRPNTDRLQQMASWQVDSIAVSAFLVILVEFDKYRIWDEQACLTLFEWFILSLLRKDMWLNSDKENSKKYVK